MNKKFDDYLVNKYPKIFADRNKSMTETAMCWGFEHSDGWFWLLDRMCDSIQSYIDINNKYREEGKKISQVTATQVKEKFGVLNFYYTGGDEYVDGIVRLAEDLSMNICEHCGTLENVGMTTGWLSVVCHDCYTKSERMSQRDWKVGKNNEIFEMIKNNNKTKEQRK